MRYDVVVIGAGPAGSRSAYLLAEQGAKVLLMDKSPFPREKVCGGLLSEKSLHLLGAWKDEIPVAQSIHKISLYGQHFKSIPMTFPSILGKTVIRSELDAFLVKKCLKKGVDFLDGTDMLHIEHIKNGVLIHTQNGKITAEYGIGADGVFSKTAVKIKMRPLFFMTKMGFAISQTIPLFTDLYDPNAVELYFIPFLGGFGWCFPLKDALNIGVGASCFSLKHLYSYYANFLKKVLNHKGIEQVEPAPKCAFIPAGGFSRCIAKDRILLVGDAAGGVDAFTGEGIDHALLSGTLAAEAVYAGLSDPHIKTDNLYARTYDRIFLAEKRLALALTLLCGHKGNIIFHLLKSNPRLTKGFCTIMENPFSYRELFMENLIRSPVYLMNCLSMKDVE